MSSRYPPIPSRIKLHANVVGWLLITCHRSFTTAAGRASTSSREASPVTRAGNALPDTAYPLARPGRARRVSRRHRVTRACPRQTPGRRGLLGAGASGDRGGSCSKNPPGIPRGLVAYSGKLSGPIRGRDRPLTSSSVLGHPYARHLSPSAFLGIGHFWLETQEVQWYQDFIASRPRSAWEIRSKPHALLGRFAAWIAVIT